MPMPLIPDIAVFQKKLATLPLATYQAGETVLSAASTTGQLLILKEGAVAVVKEGVEIARVTESGAVFGELSVLLDQPHTADVRALEARSFTSPMRLPYSRATRSRSFTLQQSWRSVSTAPIGPPRAEAPDSGRRAGRRNWENGREDRRTAGRNRCQSYVCRLSL